MEKEYLFVYGTLLKSYPNNPFKKLFAKNTKYVGKANIYARLYNLGEYPGIVKNENDENFQVSGEVFELLNSNILSDLDDYENFFPNDFSNSEYLREKTEVFLSQQNLKLTSWVYWYKILPENAVFIKSGDYLNFLVD